MQGTTVAAGEAAADAIPTTGNAALTALVLGGHLFCGLALPLLLLPTSGLWLLVLVPFVLLSVPHWALIHEAVHGHLHKRRPVNEALGRILGVLFGTAFAVLRFGHLSHHALNSSLTERPEFYDPARVSRPRAALNFYARLFFGIYFAELASSVLCFLPRRRLAPLVRGVFYEASGEEARGMAGRAERQLLEPGRLVRIRLDSALALLWLAACLLLYGVLAWAWALAVVGRGVVISFLDNAPHYGGELDDADQGHDTRAPRLVAPLILNTNLHGTHHRHPNLPWTALPGAFAAGAPAAYAGSYFAVPWRQLRGPLPYPEDRRREPAPTAAA